jgi:hypothetical protein
MKSLTDFSQEIATIGFGQAPTHKSEVGFDLAVSPDKQAFTMTFDNLQVAIPPGKKPPMATRVFYCTVPLEDAGKGAEIAFYAQGYVCTPEGATATMVLSVNGQTTVVDFPGTSDNSFIQELKFAAEKPSECRLCVFLLVGQDKDSDAQPYLNVNSINATIQPGPSEPRP